MGDNSSVPVDRQGPETKDYVFRNCSDVVPYSENFFASITMQEMVAVAVGGVLTLAIVLLFMENAWFVMRRYLLYKTKVLSLWMIGLHPVFALTAIIAVCIPRAALLSDLVATIYLSLCLRVFLILMIHYHGGEDRLIARMENDRVNLRTPPLCCCCFCCPKIEVNRKNLAYIKLCVLQVAFLRPFIVFLSAVMWADGKYVKGKIREDQAYIYLVVPTVISTLTAIYGLQLVYRASRKHLKDFNVVPKFLNMQLTLVFTNLQGMIFTILANNRIPKCRGILSSNVRGDALYHLVLIGEMFLLALVARCYYRRIDGVQLIAEINIDASIASEEKGLGSDNTAVQESKGCKFPVMVTEKGED